MVGLETEFKNNILSYSRESTPKYNQSRGVSSIFKKNGLPRIDPPQVISSWKNSAFAQKPMTCILALMFCSLRAQSVGAEFQVNSYTTNNQSLANVAMDGLGNSIIVWSSFDQDGDRWGIYGKRYDSAGTPIGSEFQVSTFFSSNQIRPDVAMDGSGNFVVVWWSLSQDTDDYGIYGQRYDSVGDQEGSEFLVNTHTMGAQRDVSIAMGESGNFIIVWASLDQDGDGWGVYSRRYDSTGTPQSSEFQVNSHTTSHQSAPSVAMDSSGNFIVVWQSLGQDGDGSGVYGQRFDNAGNPVGLEFQINTYTTSFQSSPSVAMDGSGNFVVAWQSFIQDGDNDGIYGQRYDADGNPIGSEFRVNTCYFYIQRNPSIAMDDSGNFVVVWQSDNQDGDDLGVIGQQYDITGSPLGPEFQVNTYILDNQSNPAIAMEPDGNYIVVWQSYGQDGDGYGVYGQRYEP